MPHLPVCGCQAVLQLRRQLACCIVLTPRPSRAGSGISTACRRRCTGCPCAAAGSGGCPHVLMSVLRSQQHPIWPSAHHPGRHTVAIPGAQCSCVSGVKSLCLGPVSSLRGPLRGRRLRVRGGTGADQAGLGELGSQPVLPQPAGAIQGGLSGRQVAPKGPGLPRLPRHRSCGGIREVIPRGPLSPHALLDTIQPCLAPERLPPLRLPTARLPAHAGAPCACNILCLVPAALPSIAQLEFAKVLQ